MIERGISAIVDSADCEAFYIKVGQLEGFSAIFGNSSSNNLNFFLALVPRSERSVSQAAYEDSIRALLATMPDLEFSIQEGGAMSAPLQSRSASTARISRNSGRSPTGAPTP